MVYFSLDASELTQQIIHNQEDSSTCHSYHPSHKHVDIASHCISSLSDESYKKLEEAPMKPILFIRNPSFGITNHQVEKNTNTPMVQHAYADHYLNGAYVSHPMIQPQIAPARVPLPLELSEDGPIYVNAKQYHGILRRRQIRAKLEAQNKVVKNRKPYLHESRHKHALNRVRGSGGRFLPTKSIQQSSKAANHRFSSCSTDSGSQHGFSWPVR